MTRVWRGWLRRRDPDLVAVRRAGRLTVVASLAFHIPYYVLGDRDIATYGLFSSVAMGILAQLPGPDPQLVDLQAWLAGVTKELALVTSRPSGAVG